MTEPQQQHGLIGGVERRDIVVVDHDAGWAARFDGERERISTALPVAVRIEHVGSTAVPGLAAKPIIDIQLSVQEVEIEDAYLPALLRAGYELRVRQPGHRMVRRPERDVHVHICDAGSDWERRHLLLRDWLRHDDSDREAYGALKRALAARAWADMNEYAAAKTDLIQDILGRAERWAQDVGWEP